MKYLLTSLAACFMRAFGNRALAMEVDNSDLQNLISSNEDMRMDFRDFASSSSLIFMKFFRGIAIAKADLFGKTCKQIQMAINRGYATYYFSPTFQD